MLIDTHAHLAFKDFNEDIDEVIQRAKDAGVEKIINTACDLESCEKVFEMQEKYPFLYPSLGLHPYDSELLTDELLAKWREILSSGKVVAIGETGLDYFKCKVDKEIQKNSFRKHLELAKEFNLPVIVHNRDSDEDCLDVLQEFPEVKAVFHCFASSLEFAKKIWELAYFTSFTGIVTYPNSDNLKEIVQHVPLDQFMVETDCPYLAPQAYRGKRNESSYVVEVAKRIAEIKGLSYEEVTDISTKNASSFFGI